MSLSYIACFSALVAVACAAPQVFSTLAHAPVAVAHAPVVKAVDEYDPHPQYNFGYSVNDALTGDSKSQVETRDGDVVQGSYSLIEADGSKRIVDYTADPINGFNAVVHKEAGVATAPVAVAKAVPAVVTKAVPAVTVAKPVVASAPVISARLAAPYGFARYAAPAYGYSGYAAPAYGYSGYTPYSIAHAPVAVAHAPAYYSPSVYSHPVSYHL